MVDETITTGVDALLELLKKTEKISIQDAANELHIPLDTLQSWVDFLVEERIVGIEYKFTKPFIYLNKEETKIDSKSSKGPTLHELKKEYMQRAKEKKIPEEKIAALWESHVHQELAYLEPFFTEQAQRRGVQDTRQVRALWKSYVNDLMTRLEQVK